MDARGVVERFVTALDHEDFADVARVISPGCVYVFRGAEMRGGGEVAGSYAAAAAWARGSFDSIRYESCVTDEGEDGEGRRRFRIRFVDLTKHKGVDHRHECEQVVCVGVGGSEGDDGGAGLIERIEHVDLPGERERLAAFLMRVGVASRGS